MAQPQLHPDLAKYSVTKDDIFHVDMTVFKGMAGKRVSVQSYDMDGNVMFTVKCKKNQWHTKQLDGCYWETTTGKSKRFMDGLHSHVKDYTLTLWLHNPVICHIQCIAYMDHELKKTTNIAIFLTLVNFTA